MNLIGMDFESVIRLYYEDLYRFAFGLSRNRDDAGDLTQQAFAIYAAKRGQVRDQSRLKQWLFTTLYREFLRVREQRCRVVSLEDPEHALEELEASEGVDWSVEHGELLNALMGLEVAHREVLTLFYLSQHSYKDIAEILDVPAGTVMSRLSRAKEVLRKRLDAVRQNPGITRLPPPSHEGKASSNG